MLSTTIQDSVAGVAKSTVDYQVTFSSSVTGLTASDFSVENGSVSSITGSGGSYVVRVTPTLNSFGYLNLSLNAGAVISANNETNVIKSAEDQYFITSTGTLASSIDLGRNLYSNQDWNLVIKQSYGGKDYYLALPNSSSYGFVNDGTLVLSKQIGAYQLSIPNQTDLRNLFVNYLKTGKSQNWTPPNDTKWMATAYYWTSTPVSASGRADYMAVQLGTINDQYNTFGTGKTYDDRGDAMLAYSVSVDTRVSAILKSQQLNEQSNNSTTLVVFREGVTSRSIYVPLNISGTATYNVDYVLEGDFSVVNGKVFANLGLNTSVASITLRTLKDTLVESNETVSISIDSSSLDYLSVAQPLSLTILESGPTGAVSISGIARLGEVLTASNSIADIDGVGAIIYRWSADGVEISGAVGPTFTLGQSQLGKKIIVTAYYTDGSGNSETMSSFATSAITKINDVPTGAVTITGTATQGQTLTATNSLVDADGLGTIAYTWKANGTTVSTGATYTLTQSEVGKTITATVSYTDLGGTAESVASSATSSVANVNDLPTGAVTISGTAKQGQTLTVSNSLADVDGLGFVSYTWKANGATLGTGATYKLTQSEVGKTITATASYTDLLGTPESVTSVTTGAVIALPEVGVSVSPASVNESGSTNLLYTFTRTGDTSASLIVNLNVSGTSDSSDYTSSLDLNLNGTKSWTKLLGGISGENATSLTSGTDGSIYVTGYTTSDFDGQTGFGSYDSFITKYLADGSKSWTKFLGSSSYDVAYALTTGTDGSIYVSGNTNGNLDGQINSGGQDAFITKYLPDGTKSWTKLLGSISGDNASSLTAGTDGSIYVSGDTWGNLDGQAYNGFTDAFITKYMPDGTKSWTKLLGTSGFDNPSALTTGTDGSIYVAGYTSGNLDGQTNVSGGDAFISKYLADGTKSWTKLLGTVGLFTSPVTTANALATGLDGSIYVSGFTNCNLDGQTNSGGTDAFITKYLPDGTKSWTKLLGTSSEEFAFGLTTGTDGSIYVSGNTNGNLDGQTNIGGTDAFITKYLPDGTKSWTKLRGNTGSDNFDNTLITGADGAIYLSGTTTTYLDGQINSGSSDVFITKYLVGSPQITFAAGSSTATLVIDPTPDLIVEGYETVVVSVAQGTGYDLGATSTATGTIVDTIRFLGGSGTDTFIGNHVTDTRNNFVGAGGNDDITGDSRADVAEYSGNLSDYNISASNGLITITDSRTGSSYDGTDTLHGINLLKFADGMEFVGLAAQRVALSGSEANHTVQVTESKLYSGTNAAEKFVIGSNVSSMILAGEGDTVHLSGSFTDYIYTSRGSELQITKGDFMTTVNLAGNVSIETDLGHGLNAYLDFTQATPRVMLDTQLVTMGSIDASLLNTHAVLQA